MNKCTFSNSKGAQNLATILDDPEYNRYSRKVSKILSKYFTCTSSTMFIPNKTVRDVVLKVWRERFIERINNLALPEVVKTHTLCVIVTQYRRCIREMETRKGNYDTMRKYKRGIPADEIL